MMEQQGFCNDKPLLSKILIYMILCLRETLSTVPLQEMFEQRMSLFLTVSLHNLICKIL